MIPPTNKKCFQIFGDESNFQEIVTYAFIIVPSKLQEEVEKRITKVKLDSGLKATDKIHCRELFNKHAKAKTAFHNFSKEQILALLQQLCTEIYLTGARGWVGYLNSKKARDGLIFESDEPLSSKKSPFTIWDIRNKKLHMLFTYQAAIAPLTHIISPDNVDAWIDSDRTVVPNLDNKSRQVDTLKSFFPVEHNNKKFFPTPIKGDKPSLLDIADVLAYSAAHGLSATFTKDKPAFVSIVNSLNPGYSEVIFNAQGGAMMSFRPHDPNGSIKDFIKRFDCHTHRDSI